MLFGLALLLRLLILEAAIIKELTDGRYRVRRDLNKVEITLPGHLHRLNGWDNTKLRPIFIDESNFRNSYGAINARAGRWPLWHVAGLDARALL